MLELGDFGEKFRFADLRMHQIMIETGLPRRTIARLLADPERLVFRQESSLREPQRTCCPRSGQPVERLTRVTKDKHGWPSSKKAAP